MVLYKAMPILQLVIEPTGESKPIPVTLSHAVRSQSLKLTRIHVIKASSTAYQGNYYRIRVPFLTSSRQTMNNAHRGNLIVPNKPDVRSFEVAVDATFTADNIPEVFDVLVQQAEGDVETSTTLKAIIFTFDYTTNRLF